MREESDSVKDIPEWMINEIKENNISYNELKDILNIVTTKTYDHDLEIKKAECAKYVGKCYKERWINDIYDEDIYFYYKVIGVNRRNPSLGLLDMLSFSSMPEYSFDVSSWQLIVLEDFVELTTISCTNIAQLEEISEEEFRKALHDSADCLLDIRQSTLQENYFHLDAGR